jgi:hypothetical protein
LEGVLVFRLVKKGEDKKILMLLYTCSKNRKEYSTFQPHRLNKEFELILNLNLNLNSIEFNMSSAFNSRSYGLKQINKQINEMIKISNFLSYKLLETHCSENAKNEFHLDFGRFQS